MGLAARLASEDAGLLGVLEGVKRAARDWAANAKEAAWLIHNKERLKTAEQLAQRSDLCENLELRDRVYLVACRNAERLVTVRRRRFQALVGGLALLLGAAGAAWLNQDYLKDQYYWYAVMGPTPLTTAEEGDLKPGDQWMECRRGCPQMVVLPAGGIFRRA
jgi:hypothetical protein